MSPKGRKKERRSRKKGSNGIFSEGLDRFMKEKNVAVRNPCETILKWAEQDRMV